MSKPKKSPAKKRSKKTTAKARKRGRKPATRKTAKKKGSHRAGKRPAVTWKGAQARSLESKYVEVKREYHKVGNALRAAHSG